jgi:hypothetical protein
MARQKQIAVQRTPSELLLVSNGRAQHDVDNPSLNGNATTAVIDAVSKAKSAVSDTATGGAAGMGTLIFCIAGIYASLYGSIHC